MSARCMISGFKLLCMPAKRFRAFALSIPSASNWAILSAWESIRRSVRWLARFRRGLRGRLQMAGGQCRLHTMSPTRCHFLLDRQTNPCALSACVLQRDP